MKESKLKSSLELIVLIYTVLRKICKYFTFPFFPSQRCRLVFKSGWASSNVVGVPIKQFVFNLWLEWFVSQSTMSYFVQTCDQVITGKFLKREFPFEVAIEIWFFIQTTLWRTNETSPWISSQGCSNTKGTSETRLHIFLADRLSLYQPRGVDYAHHLGVSPHLFGTLLQPCVYVTKD
jgi:hypothetical protein